MGNSSRCFISLNKCQVELLLFFGVLNFDISMSFRMNETWCDFRKYSMMYDTWWPIVFKYFNPGTKVIHHEAQQWRHWNARRKWRNRNSLGANSHRRIVKIEKKNKNKTSAIHEGKAFFFLSRCSILTGLTTERVHLFSRKSLTATNYPSD